MYAVGSNTFGECGVGHTDNNVWDWERVKGLDDAHIVDVRLGFAHAVALAGALMFAAQQSASLPLGYSAAR